MREQFEKYMLEKNPKVYLKTNSNGTYMVFMVQYAWEIWQAAMNERLMNRAVGQLAVGTIKMPLIWRGPTEVV